MNTTTTTSDSTPKQGTSIDEALGQTELGGWIAQNKTPVLSAVALIILGVFGYGIFNHFQTKKFNSYSSALYKVTSEKIGLYKDGKIQAQELVSAFNEAWKPAGSFEGAGPYVIEVTDALTSKQNYQEAYDILSDASKRLSNPTLSYFINIRAAALAEDLGKKDLAISHLKAIISGGVRYMEDKVYLDLGRLYREAGDKEKAKSSFQWVLDKGTETEFKKMARLYLEELEG